MTTNRLLAEAPDILDRLSSDDVNIVFHNRVANLKKVYPYIPESLNRVLLHFSVGAEVYYETTEELLEEPTLESKVTHSIQGYHITSVFETQ